MIVDELGQRGVRVRVAVEVRLEFPGNDRRPGRRAAEEVVDGPLARCVGTPARLGACGLIRNRQALRDLKEPPAAPVSIGQAGQVNVASQQVNIAEGASGFERDDLPPIGREAGIDPVNAGAPLRFVVEPDGATRLHGCAF